MLHELRMSSGEILCPTYVSLLMGIPDPGYVANLSLFWDPEAGLPSIIAYPFVNYIYILPIAIEAITALN